MKIFTSDSLEVSLNETQKRLILHCHGDLNSEEFKTGFLLALQSAREHQVKSWLIDLSQLGTLLNDADTWVQVHVFPQIMAYLGTDNYMAMVVSETCYEYMLNEYGLEGLKTYNGFIIIDTFSEPEAALAWLEANAAVLA